MAVQQKAEGRIYQVRGARARGRGQSSYSYHIHYGYHTTHTRTRLIQFKPPLLPAPAPPSRLCSLPALTSLFSLSTGAAEGSGFHSRRASRRARITQHTHPHGSGKKTPSKQHSTCCKTPSCSSGRHRSSSHGAHKAPALVDRDVSHSFCDLTPSR